MRVKGATDALAASLRIVLAIASVLMPAELLAAGTRLLEPSQPVAFPERFGAAMTRARLHWLVHGAKPVSIALDTIETGPSTIPFFWEAQDGSTIRRMPGGSFRMEVWSATTNWTSFVACEPAGWPAYLCSDGAMHEMSAPDLSTVIFGGRTFARTLPAPRDIGSERDLPLQ